MFVRERGDGATAMFATAQTALYTNSRVKHFAGSGNGTAAPRSSRNSVALEADVTTRSHIYVHTSREIEKETRVEK